MLFTLCISTLLVSTSPDAATVSRMPDAASLARYHEVFASEPHVAGTPGDARTIERLVAEFRAMGVGADGAPLEGFEVEIQEFFPLLARPVTGSATMPAEAPLEPARPVKPAVEASSPAPLPASASVAPGGQKEEKR